MDQPQPRPSISDSSSSPQGPVPLFEHQLLYITESYLQFFQERKRIEDIYIQSLQGLHKKIKLTDTNLDRGVELTSTRSAWNELRDNVEREAQARQAFVNTLAGDVISPLILLKDSRDRVRKRIKDDLNHALHAYNDYVENVLPKLKTRYIRKFAEVEELKRVAAMPPPPTSPPPTDAEFSALSPTRSNPPSGNRPVVTSPQPLRALDRRPSGGASSGRNRSPPSSTAFSDLASQGKRQLNQLIGFLDNKGVSVKDSLAGRESNQTQRSAKAKRELDETDKEYRKGVHWLESLRMQRAKCLENGYKSLEEFVEESTAVLKQVLQQYTDNMIATTMTQTQLHTHASSQLTWISQEKDMKRLHSTFPKSISSLLPDPVLYVHGHVGECRDLIFGVSLNDYAYAKGLGEGDIPKIVRICIQEIDKRGLELEGIYRVSGRHAIVQAMQHEIEKDEANFELSPKDDIYAVASLLKLYLRGLPDPVFRFGLQDRIEHTAQLAEQQANNFTILRSKMRPNRMRPIHRATLRAIMEHLSRVVAFQEKNKMDAKNLAIVFGTAIFGEDEMPKGAVDLLNVQTTKDTLMEDMIMNAHVLFDDRYDGSPGQHSPPLPPTPYGEPVTLYPYGSRTTKVTNVPPPLSPMPHLSSMPLPQDFTPRMPPRPPASIHVGSRTAPAPERMETSATIRPGMGDQALRERDHFDSSNQPLSQTTASALLPNYHHGLTAGYSSNDESLASAPGSPAKPPTDIFDTEDYQLIEPGGGEESNARKRKRDNIRNAVSSIRESTFSTSSASSTSTITAGDNVGSGFSYSTSTTSLGSIPSTPPIPSGLMATTAPLHISKLPPGSTPLSGPTNNLQPPALPPKNHPLHRRNRSEDQRSHNSAAAVLAAVAAPAVVSLTTTTLTSPETPVKVNSLQADLANPGSSTTLAQAKTLTAAELNSTPVEIHSPTPPPPALPLSLVPGGDPTHYVHHIDINPTVESGSARVADHGLQHILEGPASPELSPSLKKQVVSVLPVSASETATGSQANSQVLAASGSPGHPPPLPPRFPQ